MVENMQMRNDNVELQQNMLIEEYRPKEYAKLIAKQTNTRTQQATLARAHLRRQLIVFSDGKVRVILC